MDKIKKDDRRISIVLNGNEKSYEEIKRDKEVYEQLLNEEISATTEESKPEEEKTDDFQWLLSEKDKSPKIVDLGERRRDKKSQNIPFWDDGKSAKAPKLPAVKRKKKNWKLDFKSLPLGLIGIVMSAIIVGVSFGFMMLTIFTGDKAAPQTVTNPVQTAPTVDVPTVAMNGEIPILGIEVVQGGAFSQLDKAKETAEALKENGFAATLSNTTDPVFLFIGIGLDREQARVIGNIYDSNGQDVFLKPYAVSKNGLVESEGQLSFLNAGVELYQHLALLSVNSFANGGSLVTEEAIADLKVLHDQVLSHHSSYADDELRKARALAFQKELTTAFEAIQSFATTTSNKDRWQVQQSLLNGLFAYEQLVQTY